jgi:tetratricopeptide (TPR) repeat protein
MEAMMTDDRDICFVVMPFGQKTILDGSNRYYDFDKVYRVIIRRAIHDAGMKAHRADEGLSSSLIHTEMFKDLRDRPVVLADLSLENPNVFYELGIRHVMADSGTVLICREGAALPFDVALSRVVFYKFDGQSLDWEEVERVTPVVTAALKEAQRGKPDSPVHALLPGNVLRAAGGSQKYPWTSISNVEVEDLEGYERSIAHGWLGSSIDFEMLYAEHTKTIFGTRALGNLCLESKTLPPIAPKVAAHLSDQQQNRLANRVFEKLLALDKADWRDMLRYAASYSEAKPNLPAAERAIELAEGALRLVEQQFSSEHLGSDGSALFAVGECKWRISSLQRWRFRLTGESSDLEGAVRNCQEALDALRKSRIRGGPGRPGRLAQVYLINLLLLRMQDGDRRRPDTEKYQQAVLELREMPDDDPLEISWLHWYQAMALADAGDRDAAISVAQKTVTEDASLKSNPEYWEVGRRQYALICRFIEQYSEYFRDPSMLGVVSQIVQASTEPRERPV